MIAYDAEASPLLAALLQAAEPVVQAQLATAEGFAPAMVEQVVIVVDEVLLVRGVVLDTAGLPHRFVARPFGPPAERLEDATAALLAAGLGRLPPAALAALLTLTRGQIHLAVEPALGLVTASLRVSPEPPVALFALSSIADVQH